VWFRPVHVFDVSQTDGESLPAWPGQKLVGDDDGLLGALIAAAKHLGYAVEVNGESDHGEEGSLSRGGVIRLSDANSPAMQAKTLAHELGHGVMDHLDEDPRFADRGLLELEAESVAYVVASRFGLDCDGYSFAYAAHWAGDGATTKLKESCGRIERAAREIIGAIEQATTD